MSAPLSSVVVNADSNQPYICESNQSKTKLNIYLKHHFATPIYPPGFIPKKNRAQAQALRINMTREILQELSLFMFQKMPESSSEKGNQTFYITEEGIYNEVDSGDKLDKNEEATEALQEKITLLFKNYPNA